MVYVSVVGRTQIYLGEEEIALLDRVAAATGASRSELVRRAVRSTFGERTADEKIRALRASAGSWADRTFSGADYVNSVRGDLNQGLRRRGI